MSARTYVVGLPVVITVHDDGRVEYEVDTAEASSEMWEQAPEEYTEEQIRADEAVVNRDHYRKVLAELEAAGAPVPDLIREGAEA